MGLRFLSQKDVVGALLAAPSVDEVYRSAALWTRTKKDEVPAAG